MAYFPYLIYGTVYDSDGTTPVSSVTVRAKNEVNGTTVSTTSNSSGYYIIDLANSSEGYTYADIVTVSVLYSTYEAYEEHVVTTGGGNVNLTLEAVPNLDMGELKYFSVQDFYDYFNYSASDENAPSTTQVTKLGLATEAYVTGELNNTFDDNDGAYYTLTDEYMDCQNEFQKIFFIPSKYTPIYSLTKFEVNKISPGQAGTWSDLVALGTDEIDVDLKTGRVVIYDSSNLPVVGARQIRFTLKYGIETPQDIKLLCILITAKNLSLMTIGRSLAVGRNDFNSNSYTAFDAQIEDLIKNHRRLSMVRT